MKFIIVGCGRMGAGLAQALSQRGHTVAVIDRDPKAFDRLPAASPGQIIEGVGFDRDILLRAGIERADGLAAVTGSDETNVVVARLARQVFHVPRVVARLDDPRKAEIYRRLGLQTIAPVTWGVHRLADLLCYSQLDAILSLGSGDADVVETEISPALAARTVNDVTVPGEIHVVAIVRQGRTLLPTLGTAFQQGDRVYLALLAASSDRLNSLLGLD